MINSIHCCITFCYDAKFTSHHAIIIWHSYFTSHATHSTRTKLAFALILEKSMKDSQFGHLLEL